MSRGHDYADENANLRRQVDEALNIIKGLSADISRANRERDKNVRQLGEFEHSWLMERMSADKAKAWAKLWHKFARIVHRQYGLLWNAAKGEETIGQRLYFYFLYRETVFRLAMMRDAARAAVKACGCPGALCERCGILKQALTKLDKAGGLRDQSAAVKLTERLGKRVHELEIVLKSVLQSTVSVRTELMEMGEWWGEGINKLDVACETAEAVLAENEEEDEEE